MKKLIVLVFVLTTGMVWSQKHQHVNIEGQVNTFIDGKNDTPLLGAEVFLKGAKNGAITNEDGKFSIHNMEITLPDTLIIRAMDYYTDTLVISKPEDNQYLITLYPEFVSEEVVIKAKRDNSNISRLNVRNVEQLNQGELRKAACCNLSESFETNATIDVNMSDGVSGSKQIEMLGLNGRYTQLQFENIPFMHNLDQPFGLMTVPGTWISSIQITKGAGSVTNGYESMAGLINLEYHKPNMDNMDQLFVNGYGNIQGIADLNVHGKAVINDKWSTGYFVHGAKNFVENDRNKDGFRDNPLGDVLIGMNRWYYDAALFRAQLGVKASYSNQEGGEIGFNRSNGTEDLYGVGIRNLNVEAFAKTGFLFKDNDFSSIGIIYYAKYDELNSYFGNRSLDAVEKRGYVNAMYETILGNTNHRLKSGLSFVYDDVQQEMNDLLLSDTSTRVLNRTEIVPGIFSEYTYTGLRSTVVLGARADYHNLYGWQFTPRANYKLDVTENMDLRLTAGRGFRISNYATDNMSLMATNTPWVVEEDIQPEISWNFGGSWLWDFKLWEKKATWSVDFYHTLFTNQLVVDRDQTAAYIVMGNLDGRSFSNVLQTEVRFEPLQNFKIKAAYKWTDVKTTTAGKLQAEMMVPSHRGFLNLEYETRNHRWSFDATLSVIGSQRLPQVRLTDNELTTDNKAQAMPMLSAQVTHRFKHFEVYVGGENILDQRLKNPIVNVDDPFGKHFDATRVYSSIFGVNAYIGFRFMINNAK